MGILFFIPTISLIKRQILDAVALQYVVQSAEVLIKAQSVYNTEVVKRLENIDSMNITHDYHTQPEAIPLPFTYLKAIGERLVEEENDLQIRVYSDYPFPWREAEEKIQDHFEKEALEYLKANPQQEFYRYEQQSNQRVLRYTIPSVLQPSCIDCHNKYPGTPKTDWQVGDVRGILELTQVIRDYDLPVYDSLRRIVMLLTIVSCTGGLGLVIGLRRSQQYAKQLEKSVAIRQQAMDDAFSSIHNGPLQTLALILRQIQQPNLSVESIYQQLKDLNCEIRAIGKYLTEEEIKNFNSSRNLIANDITTKTTMMLGEGTILDLNSPLHELFYDTYTLTLKRNFPYFQGIKVKVCDFQPLESSELLINPEIKEKLCRWLEEAICNVGKHAKDAKRLTAVGKQEEGWYFLKVQDNGCGLTSKNANQGTKNAQELAKQLQGKFTRESASKGTVCQLSWQIKNIS